jgi:hypothetical protein
MVCINGNGIRMVEYLHLCRRILDYWQARIRKIDTDEIFTWRVTDI